ncbi:opioid growth factor receptor [Suncus etruscus]|uniref:opioid growth factor receptor n=1 Tax=Suncus etruscus TaxID=109475 RepID=UPI00210FF192|nr:opioid growth factor receptor [Suncus etruscus]
MEEDAACDSTWDDSGADSDGSSGGGGGGDGGGGPGDSDGDGDDEAEREARPDVLQAKKPPPRNFRAMRDTARYRHHYPGLEEKDGSSEMPNLSFYKNEIRFQPNGCFIQDILQNWKEDYEQMEDNHSYIQWLFPLREPGVNWHAKPLTLQEIEAFKSSPEVQKRLIQAYELMLGFYGIQLEDSTTGRVCRAPNYVARFRNLNWHSHNNLRLTRILKSLGELGLEQLQAPLVRFFLEETLVRGQLPSVRQSVLDYFVFTVRCRRQRRHLLRFAWKHFKPRLHFVWAPHKQLQRLRSSPHLALLASDASQETEVGAAAALEEGARPGSLEEGAHQGSLEEGAHQGSLEEGAHSGSLEEGAHPGSLEEGAHPGSLEEGAHPGSLKEEGACPGSLKEEGARPGSLLTEADAQQRDQGSEDGAPEPAPPSPKESKKRKLEGSLEQGPLGPGTCSISDVEGIVLNLEGCALSQGDQQPAPVPMDSQAPGDMVAQPCPQPSRTKEDDDVRKRRKISSTRSPEDCEDEDEVQEKAEGQVSPRPGTPTSLVVQEDPDVQKP